MRKFTLLTTVSLFVISLHAQLLLNENFDYPTGGLIGQGGWVIDGNSTTNPISVTSATPLNYTGYPLFGIGNEISATLTGQDVNHPFPTQTTGTIFYSCLVNISVAKTTGDYFIHLSTNSNFAQVYAKLSDSNIAFGILNSNGGTVSYTNSVYSLNTTYLIAVKFDVATGTSSLNINPGISAIEPTEGWIVSSPPTLGGTGGTGAPSASGVGKINIRQGTSTPTLKLDGLRVASNWNDLFTLTGINVPNANKLKVSIVGNKLIIHNIGNGSTVDIFSIVGSKVLSSKLINGAMPVNSLKKGLYIVQVDHQTAKIML